MTPRATDGAAASGPAPRLSRLRSRHLLSAADLTPEEVQLILDTAGAMREVGTRPIKKVPALRGKTVVNLFFEPSTRTRTSFEIAEKRLSADALNISASTSSLVKGETLADTAYIVALVKPQFEAGRDEVNRGGVVRSPSVRASAVGRVALWAIENGLRVLGVRESAITGPKGNREYFVLLKKSRSTDCRTIHD